ncbi:MAG: sigma-54 dependent transcriptional regulator [Deltaproteobacteria bacterium]|nr:sigma-54 dependent transcriptional regulator [Deltaproteobacteria bacterium]
MSDKTVNATRGTVMVIDDDALVLRTVERVLTKAGIETLVFGDADAAFAVLDKLTHVHVALCDVSLPGMSGLEFLEKAKQLRPQLEVVMMTGGTSLENAVTAMKKGAYDYLPKPFDSLEKLIAVVSHALERGALIDRNSELERLLSVRDEMSEIIGKSPAMMPVFDVIAAVADTPATVLVSGETGTGKELVARALHRLSRRRKKPFVAINCAAFTEGLLDSELFGHQKGAFTGASANRRGVFETAHEATLFLDEVGDLASGTQVRLLRALQEGEIKRVGGNDTIHVDVRVVAATHINLKEAVAQRAFREDLYYRLNVVSIHLPPLRDRVGDIPALTAFMLKKHAVRMDRAVDGISDAAMARLCAHAWPGNIRELDNCMARAVAMARTSRIEEGDLHPDLRTPVAVVVGDPVVEALPYADAKRRTVEAFEKRYLRAKLKDAGGNISRAADAAGMDRSNFKRLCRSFAVDVDEAAAEPPDPLSTK